MLSFWIDSTKDVKQDFESLNSDINVDVCIIGGGLTGITAAYYLKNSGLKVALLEKDKLCYHTSGNTTAKITSQHDLFYKYFIDSEGYDFAKKYLEANEQAIKNIKEIIDKEAIDCDFEKQDNYVFTHKQEDVQKIKDEVEAVNSLGFNSEFVQNIDLPIDILAGIRFPNQAEFNPCKYAYGLINNLVNNEDNKIEIYEDTKVIDVKKDKEEYVVVTESEKQVKAKYIVLATHYPIINSPGFYFLKMYQSTSYIIAIKPNKEVFNGMYINSQDAGISFRTAKDGEERLVLIGGSDHKTGAKIDLKDSYKHLEEIAKQIYPDCEVKYRWNAEDCISLDKIPYIGEFSKFMPNVYVGTGYKKWGMTSSNIAAKIISDKIVGEENDYEQIFKATRMEPIKNIKEVENILKETTHSLVLNKFDIPDNNINEINNNEGKIIENNGKKVGIYKDENGKLHGIKPICSHLGCELSWNNIDKTWDCPCHGSRFDYTGKSIYEPSIKNLETVDI